MAAFGFSFGVGVKARRAAAAPAAASTITALVVQGAGVLPDGADAANPNGWVAKATLPDDGASTFDPTRIVLTVSDPGFNADGTATTRSRTIRGTAIVRKQYPNEAQRLNSASAGTREVYFALSEDVYQGSTITAAEAEAGYYGDDAAGSIAGVLNSSTLAYPKPLFAWLNLQHERATGTHFSVEAVAFHQLARLGQQVACIEFTAKDAQAVPNVSATVRASAPALSDFQVKGQRVEAFKASIALANLTQADLCQVSAVVKPWIGEAWDLETQGVAWPTANPQTRLRFVNDKNGTWGGAFAYVKAGAAAGTVSLTAATARADPFPTIIAARTAIQTWNNAASAGHSDLHNDLAGATIRLMDDGAGGAVDHGLAASFGGTAGQSWITIEPDPANTALARLSLTAIRGVPSLTRWKCDIASAGNFYFDGGAPNGNIMVALDGGTLSYAASPSVPIGWQCGLQYFRNLTLAGTLANGNGLPFKGQSTTRQMLALGLGVIATDAGIAVDFQICAYALVGSTFRRGVLHEFAAIPVPNADSQDGAVLGNNRFLEMRAGSSNRLANGQSYATRGLALVQNVFERAIGASEPALYLGGDGFVQPVANLVFMANTIPGVDTTARLNLLYTDVAGAAGVSKRGVFRFNLLYQWNCKSDTYTLNTTVSGRTGNWAARYNVGSLGNVVLAGSQSGAAPDPSGSSWLGETWPAATYNVGTANVTFANPQAGTAGAGSGDYRLTGAANAAYDRVPAGLSVLAFDLAGNARRTDGTGAAGAYETEQLA